MKYLLIFILFASTTVMAQQKPNYKDSFYIYRVKANAYMDSVEMFRKSGGSLFKFYCRKRHDLYIKEKYFEEKFYSN